MELLLSEDQRRWRERAREFADIEVRAVAHRYDQVVDARDSFDWTIIKVGSKLGLRTAALDRRWGGLGLDIVTQCLLLVELSRADSSIAKAFSQCWKGSHMLDSICSEEQKMRFLPEFVADDGFVFGRGQTEAGSGSDNRLPPASDVRAGFKTSARREGDNWLLNGEKIFISHGNVAKLFFVDVRTNPAVPVWQGSSLFLVPKDTPGFTIGKVYNKAGWRFYQNADLVFIDAVVPDANRVGEVNASARAIGADRTGIGELEHAATALGVCEEAMRLARTRLPYPLPFDAIAGQILALKLSEMGMLTEALRSMLFLTAMDWDRANTEGRVRDSTNGLTTINFATTVILKVTELCMDICSSVDGEMSADVDKLVRDACTWPHMAGDAVMRMAAARRLMSREGADILQASSH